ncbi:helix-turn-helix transcriptional regulator [Marinobacterium jannaschii]|uniref:helix-turn-helix transcriptional regulator n=1 Tax=Marinobacterium jannaschii TaxID=64970 RepID=UPI0006868DF7|nr:helix-turn-helix transcriptional regulator [Marinobacterium jannaschii]
MENSLSLFGKWNQSVAELINHLEDEDLPRLLVEAISQLVKVEAVMLVLERRDKMPVLLYDLGIPQEERALHIDAYFSGAYLLDPLCLAVDEGLETGVFHLSEIAPDDFYQSDYYRAYYQETSLVDDVYFLVGPRDGVKLSFAVGRQHDHPTFSGDELALFRLMNPVVQSVLDRYWHSVWEAKEIPDGSEGRMRTQIESAFNRFGASMLTDREREVAHLLLKGHSSKSAAQKLGISPDTVQMHRKNMYAKLDISSQSELFSLFIAALSNASGDLEQDPLASYMQQGDSQK